MRLADLSLPPDRCFRIARQRYTDLTGEGARLVGGRWNSPGRPAVYLAEVPALAILETVVHLDLDQETLPTDYVLMEVDFQALQQVSGWLEDGPETPPEDHECRSFGDSFLDSGRAMALWVPSVIAPISRNLVVNPVHPLAAKVRVHAVTPFAFDRRLLR